MSHGSDQDDGASRRPSDCMELIFKLADDHSDKDPYPGLALMSQVLGEQVSSAYVMNPRALLFPSKRVGLRPPRNEEREQITMLERQLPRNQGHSCLSVYDFYCSQYGLKGNTLLRAFFSQYPEDDFSSLTQLNVAKLSFDRGIDERRLLGLDSSNDDDRNGKTLTPKAASSTITGTSSPSGSPSASGKKATSSSPGPTKGQYKEGDGADGEDEAADQKDQHQLSIERKKSAAQMRRLQAMQLMVQHDDKAYRDRAIVSSSATVTTASATGTAPSATGSTSNPSGGNNNPSPTSSSTTATTTTASPNSKQGGGSKAASSHGSRNNRGLRHAISEKEKNSCPVCEIREGRGSVNYIGDRGILPILEVIRYCKKITHLGFAECGLRNNGVECLVEMLTDATVCPDLREIDLEENMLTIGAGKILLEEVRTRRREYLRSVKLDGTRIDDHVIKAIEDALMKGKKK